MTLFPFTTVVESVLSWGCGVAQRRALVKDGEGSMSSISDHTHTPSGVISANPHPNVELVRWLWCGIQIGGVLLRVLPRTIRTPTPLLPQGLCFFGKVCWLSLRTKLRANLRERSFSEPSWFKYSCCEVLADWRAWRDLPYPL